MQNNQLKSPVDHDVDHITVHHVFRTVQGEGPFAGRPSIFVRLYGCNLQCPLCDTEYTGQMNRHTIAEAVDLVRKHAFTRGALVLHQKQLVVITGGEPFRQHGLGKFVLELATSGFLVQIETNGTLATPEFPWGAATIVCSPKTPRVNEELARHARHFKYVLEAEHVDPTDGLPTRALGGMNPARPPAFWQGTVYLQPADEQNSLTNRANLDACIKSCFTFGYHLGIQNHKNAGLE